MADSNPPTSELGLFDPDTFKMSIGDHLEELRWRLILALLGFLVIAGICLWFGRDVMSVFCAPLVHTLQKYGLSPQLHSDEVPDVFMSYVEISLISAAASAAPWIVYQIWQFIAAGLYPHERKYVTKYVPLSLGLLITGMLFVYFLVLPWTLEFFISFSTSVPLPTTSSPLVVRSPSQPPPFKIDEIAGDPATPIDGQMWFDTVQQRLKFYFGKQIKVIPFGADNLIATEYNLPEYIDLVVGMLITFGLSFQMPIVVMALARVGIVPISTLKAFRKYVYFFMAILAAAITPGDVITATIALMIPLCLLYELGIWLAIAGQRKADAERDV
jgi:sec-independent protein translocase protein TatC